MENKVIINLDEYMVMKDQIKYYESLLEPLQIAAKKESDIIQDPFVLTTKSRVSIDEYHIIAMLKKHFECDEAEIRRKEV